MSARPPQFRFDGFCLRTDSGELVRDGRVIRLQEQPLTVLVELLSRPGEVVTRDQLIARLWPRGVVDYETGLNTIVHKLRLALGDDAEAPRYIETLPRRGYRFIGTLEPTPGLPAAGHEPREARLSETTGQTPAGPAAAAAGPPFAEAAPTGAAASDRQRPAWGWVLAAAAALAAVVIALAPRLLERERAPAPRSLAVLPFQALLPGVANPALELGMTDTLITQLSAIPQLRVRSLAAVRPYGGPGQDPLAAGRALEADFVLEGSLQADGDRLRVNARLLRVSDGQALWAEDFDESLSSLFELQDAVAHRVVRALAVRLSPAQERRLARPATSSPAAYQHYAAGLYLWQQRRPEAVAEFEAALREDPRYVPAWTGLANALAALAVYGYAPPGDVFPRAKQAALRAVELDPDSAAAHTALGQVLVQGERRYREGEQAYLTALGLDPDDAVSWFRLGIVRAYLGRLDEATTALARARALEPLTLNYSAVLAMLKYLRGDLAGARAELERVLRLDADFDHARAILGRVLLAEGQVDAALEQFRRVKRPVPGHAGDLGYALARAGRVEAARAELDRLARLAAQGFGTGYDAARIHAALGDTAAACAALDRALADGSPLLGFLRDDPALRPLRGQPCYADVLRRLEAAPG